MPDSPVPHDPLQFLLPAPQRLPDFDVVSPFGSEKTRTLLISQIVPADAQQRAVVRHQRRQGVAGRLGVVKIPFGVDLQPHRELVEVLGDLVVAVEGLLEVGLAVARQVVQDD
jgi:hypothetical protein